MVLGGDARKRLIKIFGGKGAGVLVLLNEFNQTLILL